VDSAVSTAPQAAAKVVSVNGVVVSKQYQPRRPLIDVGTRAGVIPRRIAGR